MTSIFTPHGSTAPADASPAAVSSPAEHRAQCHAATSVDGRLAAARNALGALLRRRRSAIAADWTKRHLALDDLRSFVDSVTDGRSVAAFYRRAYLEPLLILLEGTLRGDRPAWSAVYLDERTRFFVPADVQRQTQAELLAQVLAQDSADLARRLPRRLQAPALSLLSTLHAPLLAAQRHASVRLLLVGDCLMTEIRAFLIGRARDAGIELSARHQYLSVERGVALDLGAIVEHLNAGAADIVALSFFTFEGLPLYRALLADAPTLSDAQRATRIAAIMQSVHDVIARLRDASDVPILLHTACGLPLEKWRRRLPLRDPLGRAVRLILDELNHELRILAGGIENVIVIDEVAAVAPGGLRAAAKNYFPRPLRRRALFHTSAVAQLLADRYVPVLSAFARLRRVKVLFVDFDHTLWAGVMAEGDVVHDIRAQRLLAQLREAGILLVALSKNDPRAIRWNEMHLSPDDFVLHKIGWNQKAQAISEAAQQLALGIDSFAVIDDNPAERALIAAAHPQVVLLDPAAPDTWDAVERMLSFPNTRRTAESAARTAMYREAAARREAMVADLDYPQMMASLELRATWSRGHVRDLARIHELLARTNQFNTTTRRRTPAEVRELLTSSRYRVYACSLADRFGDLGIVGVTIVERAEDALIFDAIVMSCRAMGFGLEQLLVRGALEGAQHEDGIRRPAIGLFIPTARNEPAASIFKQAGFAAGEDGRWHLAAHAAWPEVPAWLNVGGEPAFAPVLSA